MLVMAYRCGKWKKVAGRDLVPGDVVSIGPVDREEMYLPADMLILAGTAIVNEANLTGESIPQWKVSIMSKEPEEHLSVNRDKKHVLFGGTKILHYTPDMTFHMKTPDGGCLAIVLRTWCKTTRGKQMQTIFFSRESVTSNSWENGLSILLYVLVAVTTAGYVFKKGLEVSTQLLFAVNASLFGLRSRDVYSSEPVRILDAGKVDICCFDKTGTLTSDDMEFSGFCGLSNDIDLETHTKNVPPRTLEILASCHALVFVDNKLVGDPLEKAAIKWIDRSNKSDDKTMPNVGGGSIVHIVQRFKFASHLRRMAVVVRTQDQFYAFVKGAPETIQERLNDIPKFYVSAYKKYARQGSRVVALAYKHLLDMTVSEARNLDREVAESGLTFAGFAVFDCPIREDSATVLSELKKSSHDLAHVGVAVLNKRPLASIGDTSPFTAKYASVSSTTDIVRQGRSILLTTLQMLKILGLNCLSTVYILSVIYFQYGVMQGKAQSAISGIFTTFFFVSILDSRPPLPTLSAQRPHSNVFCFYVMLSILGQFALHILFFNISVKEAKIYMPAELSIKPDESNMVNTVSYIVSMMIQVTMFAVNYNSHPFNQSLSESESFKLVLLSGIVFCTMITTNVFRHLNDLLMLVPLPRELREKLLIWMAFMFFACYTWERFLMWGFSW